MTPLEHLLLDNLNTQLFNNLRSPQRILVTNAYSAEFINTLRSLYPDHTYENIDIPEMASNRFNIIIDSPKMTSSISNITAYKPFLKKDGIVAVGTDNRSLLQRSSQGSNLLLRRDSDKQLYHQGFTTLFREPAGKFSVANHLSPEGNINKILRGVGRYLPDSKIYSPYILGIYVLSTPEQAFQAYNSVHSLKKRVFRVRQRILYKVQNHKINDSLIRLDFYRITCVRMIKSVLLIHHRNFYKYTVNSIPILHKKADKPSLVIAMTYLQTGGVERVMLNIIKGLDRSKFTIHLLTTVPSHNEWHDKFAPYVDTIVHIADIIDIHWPDSYRTRYVEEYVTKNNADVLFITNSHNTYEALPFIKDKLPSLAIYDLLHTHGTPRDNDAYLRISLPFDPYINRRIVIDQYLKNYYCNKYPIDPHKVSVIYNSLDSETLAFRRNSTKPDLFFEGLPNNKKIITYVGRLEFDKSPLRLVTIAHQLKKRSLEACIVIVGEGTLRKQMQEEAKKLDILDEYIFFYGHSDRPLEQMALSDFTILVSNAEGVPMSVLESMNVKTPPIASAVGGVPEIITDTTDGFLVPILNTSNEEVQIELFANAIETAVSLDHRSQSSMGNAARQKIVRQFSSAATIYQLLFATGEIINEGIYEKDSILES